MANQLEEKFLTAFEQNQQKLFRICSVYSRNSEDTKDLFQEVLFHIWRSMPSFQGKSSLGTWMFRITLNVCIRVRSKHTRNIKRFVNIDSITVSSVSPESAKNEQDELLQHLRNCIRELNEADKAVIALYLEELSYKQISNITGLLENTIAVKVKRIKKKLLNCINARS